MTREEFDSWLGKLKPNSPADLEKLVSAWRRDAEQAPASAIRYVQTGGPQGVKALSVVSQLLETGVTPMLDTARTFRPGPPSWLLFEVARGVTTAERAVVKRLRAALKDGRHIEPQDKGPIEEKQPRFRICDEAYLALRRLLHSESRLQFSVESRHFLSLPETEKNDEIEKYRKNGIFTQFLGDVDE